MPPQPPTRSQITPAKQSRPALKGVVIKEPIITQKATVLSVPEGKGKALLVEIEQLSPHSSLKPAQRKGETEVGPSIIDVTELPVSPSAFLYFPSPPLDQISLTQPAEEGVLVEFGDAGSSGLDFNEVHDQ